MCRAAAEGAVDFGRGDPRDRLWWLNLTIRLDHIEERNCDRIREMNHAAVVALLARPDLTDESTAKLREHADSLVLKAKKSLFPWMDFDESSDANRAIAAMSAAWVAEWGDPGSPETAARIEATARAMAAQLVAPPAPTPVRRPVPKTRPPATRPRRRPGRI